jgi:hypothetical protein
MNAVFDHAGIAVCGTVVVAGSVDHAGAGKPGELTTAIFTDNRLKMLPGMLHNHLVVCSGRLRQKVLHGIEPADVETEISISTIFVSAASAELFLPVLRLLPNHIPSVTDTDRVSNEEPVLDLACFLNDAYNSRNIVFKEVSILQCVLIVVCILVKLPFQLLDLIVFRIQ